MIASLFSCRKCPLVLATPNFEYVVRLVSRSDKPETRQSLQIDGFGEDPYRTLTSE